MHSIAIVLDEFAAMVVDTRGILLYEVTCKHDVELEVSRVSAPYLNHGGVNDACGGVNERHAGLCSNASGPRGDECCDYIADLRIAVSRLLFGIQMTMIIFSNAVSYLEATWQS